MKALIFDIKRFSVHDGPGIRTTIFLKGCPLRCVWCQNPEGLETKQKILYRKSLCENYHECIKIAPNNVKIINDGITIVNQDFKNWDQVIENCPTNAIQYDSKYYSIEMLMNIILKDKKFYRENGGVTISGGEPLLQYEFLIELLKACKKNNINTCIETSGYIDNNKFKNLLQYLDNIYMDFKIFDTNRHFEYTGVYNEQIKVNLKTLLASDLKDKAIIRTPLIPGITNSKENIENISKYLCSINQNTKYELLNFNPLSYPKYKLTGKEYFFKLNPARFSNEEMTIYCNYARENLKNIINIKNNI